MDDRMPDDTPEILKAEPLDQGTENVPKHDAPAPKKSAAEYAETFDKAVDVAEQVLRFAPLPAGAKRVATRAMPTVKKVAKVAPMVAPKSGRESQGGGSRSRPDSENRGESRRWRS